MEPIIAAVERSPPPLAGHALARGWMMGDEKERVVVFGTLLALGLGLAAVGVPPVKAFLLAVLVSSPRVSPQPNH